MEKETKKEYYEVVREWENDGRRHRIVRMHASPDYRGTHLIEVEYREIKKEPGKPEGWEKIPGSEQDLGPVNQ